MSALFSIMLASFLCAGFSKGEVVKLSVFWNGFYVSDKQEVGNESLNLFMSLNKWIFLFFYILDERFGY